LYGMNTSLFSSRQPGPPGGTPFSNSSLPWLRNKLTLRDILAFLAPPSILLQTSLVFPIAASRIESHKPFPPLFFQTPLSPGLRRLNHQHRLRVTFSLCDPIPPSFPFSSLGCSDLTLCVCSPPSLFPAFCLIKARLWIVIPGQPPPPPSPPRLFFRTPISQGARIDPVQSQAQFFPQDPPSLLFPLDSSRGDFVSTTVPDLPPPSLKTILSGLVTSPFSSPLETPPRSSLKANPLVPSYLYPPPFFSPVQIYP